MHTSQKNTMRHFISFIRSNFLLFIIIVFLPAIAMAQEPIKTDTLIRKLDSLQQKTDTVKQINNITESAYNENTKLSGRDYFLLLSSNIK